MNTVVRGVIPVLLVLSLVRAAAAQSQDIPELTRPVNDFADVIDPNNEAGMDTLIRELQQASGDVVVVAAVRTFQPYADLREYAVRMFENRGRGIGQKGKDNGLLIVLAVDDRQVWVEVGYDLEEFVTDGFAGETSRNYMVPEFRRGEYGAGLMAGLQRIVSRIADRRNVELRGIRVPAPSARPSADAIPTLWVALFVLFLVINAIAGRTRRSARRHWGGRGWSGWHSGVGPFGGGFGGFGGSGGFGGGFGGFGGGRSGGGGGGAGW